MTHNNKDYTKTIKQSIKQTACARERKKIRGILIASRRCGIGKGSYLTNYSKAVFSFCKTIESDDKI